LVENSATIKLKDDEKAKLHGAHVGLGWCYERVDLKFHLVKKEDLDTMFIHAC
jgi:hypothetical protein